MIQPLKSKMKIAIGDKIQVCFLLIYY
jgi:hypothetical protein